MTDDYYHSGRGGLDSRYPLLGDPAERPPNLAEDFTRPPQPRQPSRFDLPTFPSLIAREIIPSTQGGQFTSADRSGVLISINPKLGAGYLEFNSRDLFVQWSLSESQDIIDFDRQFRTGPASYAGVYLLSGGILRYECKDEPLQFTVPVDYAGLVDTTLRPRPRLQARFYPSMVERPKAGNPRTISWDRPPYGDLPPIIAPNAEIIAYPPHYANSFTIETDAPILVQTMSRGGIARQSVAVTQRAALSCSPWEMVLISAQANQAVPCLTWCQITEVVF
jgi:hypothetical protein